MDTNNTSPQGSAPGPQPGVPHRSTQSIGRRPMIDGFAPRRPMQPPATILGRPTQVSPGMHPSGALNPQAQARPLAGPQPMHVPKPVSTFQPAAKPAATVPHQPQMHVPAHAIDRPVHADFTQRPHAGLASPAVPAVPAKAEAADEQPVTSNRPGREKSTTGHAGLVGFAVFVVLAALLLSPFVPGKIMQNFPFASSNFSTGDQSLDCIGTQGTISTATKYDTKAGAPITYRYSASTTQTATCDGQSQQATTGHTSQFNPLGLLIDSVTALAVAIAVARVWRLIFGEKRHVPRHRED